MAVFAIDLRKGLCARLPRFTKDWMEIVHPSRFSDYLEMLYREFQQDGARWVAAPGAPGYLLELPEELRSEMLVNGQVLVSDYKRPLAFGDRVEAQFGEREDEAWYLGTIDRVRADGLVDVIYDDNDFEFSKPAGRVRRIS